MRIIRIGALAFGWLMLLSGSAAFIIAGAMAAVYGSGVLGLSTEWANTAGGGSLLISAALLGAGGVIVMATALPVMFFGCRESRVVTPAVRPTSRRRPPVNVVPVLRHSALALHH